VQGEANAIAPNKRMLSSMTPTILVKDHRVRAIVGSPGGPTIITTVAQILRSIIDYDKTIDVAVAAPRIHHQWLPDQIRYEHHGFSPDTLNILTWLGHDLREIGRQGVAQVIVVNHEDDMLEGGLDRRVSGGSVATY
jgi:gamma-glutamyltranspeptidase/glutathione hydrolase